MRVIFLDFDGVLNSDPFLRAQWEAEVPWGRDHIDPRAVRLLNGLWAPDVRIVVSSTWRVDQSVETLRSWLEHHGLRIPVIGFTPNHGSKHQGWGRGVRGCRGDEIAEWLRDCRETVESFVVVDDDDDMSSVLHRLVQTDPRVGLTEEHVERMSLMLGLVGLGTGASPSLSGSAP